MRLATQAPKTSKKIVRVSLKATHNKILYYNSDTCNPLTSGRPKFAHVYKHDYLRYAKIMKIVNISLTDTLVPLMRYQNSKVLPEVVETGKFAYI